MRASADNNIACTKFQGLPCCEFHSSTLSVAAMPPMSKRRKVLKGRKVLKARQFIKKANRLVGNTEEAASMVALALKEAEAEKQMALALKEAEAEKQMALALKEAEAEKQMALVRKEAEMALALQEKETEMKLKAVQDNMQKKIDITRLKYVNVSSRFWLELVFEDFANYAWTKGIPRASKFWENAGGVNMSKVNKYLVSHPAHWQAFLNHQQLCTVKTFPKIPEMLLYGAASCALHQPLAGLVIVEFSSCTQWPDYVELFHDVGEFYAKRRGYHVERLDLTDAHAALMEQGVLGVRQTQIEVLTVCRKYERRMSPSRFLPIPNLFHS